MKATAAAQKTSVKLAVSAKLWRSIQVGEGASHLKVRGGGRVGTVAVFGVGEIKLREAVGSREDLGGGRAGTKEPRTS